MLLMFKMRPFYILAIIALLVSCTSNTEPLPVNLADYVELNSDLVLSELIACAGGNAEGIFEGDELPTSVIYLPIEGATEVRYYESNGLLDSLDFSAYTAREIDSEPIINGKLRKFNIEPFEGEKMSLVSYITEGRLHICNPIRLKTNTKPTEVNNNLVNIQELGVNPRFDWEIGQIDENAIYFQVIADENGNFISGTYTFEQNFTFYDLDNVVLNITDPESNPTLEPDTDYTFTLMGVSLDNWVNLLIKRDFSTN